MTPKDASPDAVAAPAQAPSEQQDQQHHPDDQQRGGVMGWVKGRIQKRNITASMNNIKLDDIERNTIGESQDGEPSDLDIVMGVEDSDNDNPGAIKDGDKIDLEAENDEGLLVGWGKKLQEVEWVQKTVQALQDNVANQQELAELREIHETYKEQIKADEKIKALNKKIKKIKKNLKVQRLNGDRTEKRNTFQRSKEQAALDARTSRLQKAIWTFANSSMNSHEYAKAMMRASARLKRKGFNVHKSEKALAMEAAVLRNMHRMLAIQKQYTMSKRACSDVSSFIKRCKGWLDNKLADGEMCIMILEATSKSREILYQEVVDVQEALIPKFQDPKDHTFKKERMKTILALPKGLRSMPTFLKGPARPIMKISLTKKSDPNEDPNLKGYKTFKEQGKAMEAAWKEEMAQYENMLEVGGRETKIFEPDDVSDLGDSEDEIEKNLAAVSIGAAAAKKSQDQKEDDGAGSDVDKKALSGVEAPSETTAEEADAAALQEAQQAGAPGEEDPDVDEGALPAEVNKKDLDDLLNKEVEEEVADADGTDSHAIEEGLHQVVEDTLAGVSAEADISGDEDADDTETRDESTK